MSASDTDVWNLSLEDIESGTGVIREQKYCLVSELGSAKCSFDARNVLYSKLRPYLNKVVIPLEPGVGTSELVPLLPNPARLNRRFLAYYLRSPEFVDFAVANSRGANLPRVAMRALWEHPVPCPPLEEQQRVVNRIEDGLERLSEVRRLSVEARREAAAVFPSLLANRFQSLADGCPVAMIDDVVIETRYGTSRRCSNDRGGTPVLRIPNVTAGAINLDELKFCNQFSEQELPKLLLQDSDLLIVRTNGSQGLVGRCAVFYNQERPYAYASYLIRIRPNPEKVNPQFLAFFLESTMGRDAIAERTRTSAGQYNINSKNLRTISFPCPPLGVQREIVEAMVHQRLIVSKVIAEHSGMAQQDETLRQAILRKAFAGEL